MRSLADLMGVSPTGFDVDHTFVTSWLLSPTLLASLRLLISIYCVATIFTGWGYDGTHNDAVAIGRGFSYFTDLTYWGITFYFLVSSVHGFVYVKHGQSWLHRWPKTLQMLHTFYYTTIVTFPFLVTIVFWAVLYDGNWYTLVYDAWSNVSKHALNSLFALFETIFTSTRPPPFFHLLFLWIILGMYLGLAYLTHYAQGWYTYSFLDPVNGTKRGRVAAYSFGIVAATAVIFLLVWALVWTRARLTRGRAKKSQRDVGGRRAEGGFFYAGHDDVEMHMK